MSEFDLVPPTTWCGSCGAVVVNGRHAVHHCVAVTPPHLMRPAYCFLDAEEHEWSPGRLTARE
jgi:hypothetical protein